MLKLYSAEEIKTSKASELARDIMRTADIKKALDKARTELNDTNDSFEIALANQRVKWLGEQEKATLEIGHLIHEVEVLKKQREQLLIPIDLDRKRVDNIIIEANNLMSKALDKQKDNDDISEKLQDRLDEVSEKEQSLQTREEHLFAREKGCTNQEEIIKKNSQALTDRMQSFLTEMEQKEQDFNTKKRQLDLIEISIQEQERDLEARERQVKSDKQLIYSQRMALKAVLQSKNNGKS